MNDRDDMAIEAGGLTKRYGDLLAVDAIDFDVRRGEVFGFLGPNGAGKTTTVKMLTTLLEPTAGTIRVDGFDVAREPVAAKARMGVVPEESNVYIELSARANLLFAGQLHGLRRAERRARADDLLERFGLSNRARSKVREFSKGMRRRLTVAMALMNRPSILFLDEPISGLDVRSARAIKSLVRRLNESGVTVFLTTHQIEVANELCHRVAIIHHGRIATTGKPANLRAGINSVQTVEVTFAGEPADIPSLADLSGVSREVALRDGRRLFTDRPADVIPALVEIARRHGLRIASLNTFGPSLEDVFISVTGGDVGAAHPEEAPSAPPDRRPPTGAAT